MNEITVQTPDAVETPPVDPYLADEQKMLDDYQHAASVINQLVNKWVVQVQYAERGRKTRFIEADVETLQAQNVLASDETFIPIRVIDTAIRRELPAAINFLVNSRRIITFKAEEKPTYDCSRLEDEFTSGARYGGWQIPFFKTWDGAAAFGWDSVEVEFDESKPLHFAVRHIGNENLVFPIDSKDVQGAECCGIKNDLTKSTLRQFVSKYGFDRAQVDKIVSEKDNRENKNITVYKMFFKVGGVVFVAWWGKECDGWLKKPVKLFLGRKHQELVPVPEEEIIVAAALGQPPPNPGTTWIDTDETEFPVRILPYQVSEQDCITANRGRIFLDQTKQESQTMMWSSLVNGCGRASNVYGSPEVDNANGASPAQIDCELEHGKLYNTKINFWSPPYPDSMLIKAAQALDTETQQEAGQVNFAVANRQDSRKTATEIDAAQQQQTTLSSVQVTLFSNFIREVYSLCWNIAQSQAIQGKIVLLQIEQPDQMGSVSLVNDVASLSMTFTVKSAGDIDVVQKQEQVKLRLSLWPIIVATPLAMAYLSDLIKLVHPDDFLRYQQIIQAAMVEQQLIQGLGTALQAAVTNPDGSIKPEFAQHAGQLQQLETQVQQYLAAKNQPAAVGNSPQQPQSKGPQ